MSGIRSHSRSVPAPRVETAVRELVRQGTLDDSQAAAVVTAVERALAAPEQVPPRSRWVPEIAGYLGGALVAVALMRLVATSWNDLERAGRALILFGLAAALVVAGLAIAGWTVARARGLTRTGDDARRRLVSVFFTLAAALTGGAVGAVLEPDTPLLPAMAATVVAGLGYVLVPSAVGHLGTLAAVATAVAGTLAEAGLDSATWFGLGFFVVGVAWAVLAFRGVLAEPFLGSGAGAAVALLGAQASVGGGGEPWVGYLLAVALALGCFTVYARTRNWLLLGVGFLTVATVGPQALVDLAGESLRGIGAVLVVGLALVAVAVSRLGRAHGPTRPEQPRPPQP